MDGDTEDELEMELTVYLFLSIYLLSQGVYLDNFI